jgi:glutamate-1-semialdehyde 2,1-aminomutase
LEPIKNDLPLEYGANIKHEYKNGQFTHGDDNFLTRLKEVCHRNGAVLIFDEMISGIRFDIKGAHHLWGVYPDLATYGKCISNGFCFSMLAGKKEIMELGGLNHDKERVFVLSQTHGSETIGLAAAMATLKECERVNINEHIWAIGKKLRHGFMKLAEEEGVSDYIKMLGFDCNPQIICTKKDGTYWPELHTSFHEEVIENGVLIPWITITYAHTDVELELTFKAML